MWFNGKELAIWKAARRIVFKVLVMTSMMSISLL
jgi:hypothetical protein